MRLARVRVGDEVLAVEVDEAGSTGRVLDVAGDDPLAVLVTSAADGPGHPGAGLAAEAELRRTERSSASTRPRCSPRSPAPARSSRSG